MKKLISFFYFSLFTCSFVNAQKEVKIGTLVWMTENLNVDKFRNGDPIPTEWYIEKNKIKIYNWYAVIDPRGLAPAGWHVATINDWITLNNIINEKKYSINDLKSTSGWGFQESGGGEIWITCSNCENWSESYRDKVPCHKCKNNRKINTHKKYPITKESLSGTNKTGFSLLPSITTMYTDHYDFWTSNYYTRYDYNLEKDIQYPLKADLGWIGEKKYTLVELNKYDPHYEFFLGFYPDSGMFSVRCVKD